MNKLENICSKKVILMDKAKTSFQDVKDNPGLYDCVFCSGQPGSCPDYINHRELIDKAADGEWIG